MIQRGPELHLKLSNLKPDFTLYIYKCVNEEGVPPGLANIIPV